MKEVYTRAIVLSREHRGDFDDMVSFFTEDLGKVRARAISIRKITSKLSGHLQPMRFVKVRLALRRGGDGYVVIDSILDGSMIPYKTYARRDLLPFISFINAHVLEFQTDRELWFFLIGIFTKVYSHKEMARVLLRILGITSRHEPCVWCAQSPIVCFSTHAEGVLCSQCALKVPRDTVLWIEGKE